MGKELWKPIPEFEGIYSVSNLGRIRSEARTIQKSTGPCKLREKARKSILGKDGYRRVSLRRDNKTFTFLVHRPVLLSFRGKPVDNYEGCHLDGNSENNCLDNLIWAPHSENEKHKIKNGTTNHGSNHYLSKLTESKVKEIKVSLAQGVSQQKLGDSYGVDRRVINQIATGKTWKHVEI